MERLRAALRTTPDGVAGADLSPAINARRRSDGFHGRGVLQLSLAVIAANTSRGGCPRDAARYAESPSARGGVPSASSLRDWRRRAAVRRRRAAASVAESSKP